MKFHRLLLITAIGIVIAIWVLSLLPLSQSGVPGSDKIHHFLAYFACMFFWGQCYPRPAQRLVLTILFILMGVLVEFAQGLTGYRYYDWQDMVANGIGVAAAWLVVAIQLSVQRRVAGERR